MLVRSHAFGKLEVTFEDAIQVKKIKVKNITVRDGDEEYCPYTLTIEDAKVGEDLNKYFNKLQPDWKKIVSILTAHVPEGQVEVVNMLSEQLNDVEKVAPEMFEPVDLSDQRPSFSENCNNFFAKGFSFLKTINFNCCKPTIEIEDEFNHVQFNLIDSSDEENENKITTMKRP